MQARFLALALLLCAPAVADEQVEKIFDKARHINPTLQDYSADMSLKLDAMLGFIPYHPEMAGQYFYKKPDKHKLDIKKAPNYMKKYPSAFGFKLPNLDHYDSKVEEEVSVEGETCYHVHLKNLHRVDTDIDHLEIYVNKSNYTVPRFDTYYATGHLFVTSKFLHQQGFYVFERMTADFEGTGVTVKAVANYGNYKFNSNLPDSLFAPAAPAKAAKGPPKKKK